MSTTNTESLEPTGGSNKRKLNMKEHIRAYIIAHQGRQLLLPLVLAVVLFGLIFVASGTSVKTLAGATETPHDNSVAAQDDVTKLTFVGDIMLSRNIAKLCKKVGYSKLFIPTEQLFASSDMVMGNLDCTVLPDDVKNYSMDDRHTAFYTNTDKIHYLSDAGIDVLSLATDHIADLTRKENAATGAPKGTRRDAVINAIAAMNANGIAYVGAGYDNVNAGTCRLFNANGTDVAIIGMLGYFPYEFAAREGQTGVFATRNLATTFVNDAADNADVVVVYLHWGEEYMLSETDEMRQLAHDLIDAGADIIIGSNPHVVLPVETYKWGIIAYSVGSFIFDEANSRACDSIAFSYILNKDGSATVEITPLRIATGIPSLTTSPLYVNRIFSAVTKKLSDDSYTITENKVIINMPAK